MKKIILTLLISSISLTSYAKPNYSYTIEPIQTQNNYQGTYINEEVDVPITQIGIPQQYTQPQTEEKGLEIVWNKWHANVRNKFSNDISDTNIPKNYIIATMCTIDTNRKISDIIITYFPESSILAISRTANIKNNVPFYVYMHSSNKYFKATIKSTTPFTIGAQNKNEQQEMSQILSNATLKEEAFYKIPYFKFYEELAERMNKRQGQPFLEFPESTRRTSVTVTSAVTDLSTIATVRRYTADMFNDTERQ